MSKIKIVCGKCTKAFNEHHSKIGAVRNVVGIRCGAISGNMKVSFQAARSIG
jgi:predicted metal-binding protein